MNALQTSSEADFSQLAPVLDEAVNALGETDRTVILLRFFEQHDFRSVGQALGSNEAAARMRVNRALEKLATLLKRRGVTSTSAGLAVLLGANVIQAAPVSLAVTISSAAVMLTGSALTATATATATKAIAMTTLQKAIVAGTLAVALGAGVYQAREASNARADAYTLRQKQTPLEKEIRQLHQEREAASNHLAVLEHELARLKGSQSELLRLRGEIGVLRQNQATAQTSGNRNPNSSSDLFAQEQNIGRALGMAVVEGDPTAMTKLRAFSQAKLESFNTNAIGLDDGAKGDLAVKTFAPVDAAFDVIAEAASKGNQRAFNALLLAAQHPELKGHATDSFGFLAGEGNEVALDILLNPSKYNLQLLLSGIVSAVLPAANKGNEKAIELLASVVRDVDRRPLWTMAASGLQKPAQSGHTLANEALRDMHSLSAK